MLSLRFVTPLFETDSLTHRYGAVLALDGVSLTVEPGAIGLVGQNGAGKSTLIKVLLGLLCHTSGTVRVFGSDIAKYGVGLRGRIGYMPEREGVTPGLNGIEYVGLSGELNGMPRKIALRRAHELLSQLGLEEARYRRLENYSAGMVQRIKLAATLVHDPDLLLLDEPTSGLDPDGRSAMLTLLKSLAQRPGKSLLFSTHLLGDIEHVCRHTIIMEKGRIAASGSLDEMLAGQAHAFLLQWKNANGTTNDAYIASLQEAGADVSPGEELGQARVVLSGEWSNQQFFQLAKQAEVTLTGIEPEEMDLRTVYHRLVGMETAGPPLLGMAKSPESGVAS
ncbi:MAG: ABC transporter ATP-binding protein [Verrucomicrobiota bacterium]|nr:ABC transporter ATP-binding protein [Verrucomicrobiota bacterium]